MADLTASLPRSEVGAGCSASVPNARRTKWTTFHIRMSRDLHDRIGKSSKRHGRSMTSEIIARLERLYIPENNDGMAAD